MSLLRLIWGFGLLVGLVASFLGATFSVVLFEVAIFAEAECVVRAVCVLALAGGLLAPFGVVAVAAHSLAVEGFGCVGALSDLLVFADPTRQLVEALCHLVKLAWKGQICERTRLFFHIRSELSSYGQLRENLD